MKLSYTSAEAKTFLANGIKFFETQKNVEKFSIKSIELECKNIEKKTKKTTLFTMPKSKRLEANKRLDSLYAVYYLLKCMIVPDGHELTLKQVKELQKKVDIDAYAKKISVFQPLKDDKTNSNDFVM